MKSVFAVLLVLSVVLVSGCGQILEKDQTTKENADWLAFSVLEYDNSDSDCHVVWTYDYKQGLLGISTPDPIRSTRQVIFLKDGKIVAVVDLGADRSEWVAMLKAHGIGWSETVFSAIEKKQVDVGMSLEQVMFCWGHPQVSPPYNYRVTRHREDLKADDRLYYPMYGHAHVVMQDGVVVALESVRMGAFERRDKFDW
ncbi:MAG: hypothetical protein G01um101419_801 [Parcubacteria group bacterium Gr01-1014_19]|nr:MAG: hypothetical protein G01um101419_801 [Parcubacteria group bacterium Gr01-1014_19]